MSTLYWEERYQSGDTPWDKGAPSPGLVDFISANAPLPGRTVCVPGCGTGHDAQVWATAGFRAYGYDIAPSAVRLAKQAVQGSNLPVQFRVADFLRDEPPFPFDWLFEHTLFCAILPAERELYVQAVERWLKLGGRYLAVSYFTPDEDGPPFTTTRDEQVRRFSPRFELCSDWMPRSYPNRTGLERMFLWRKSS